MKKSRLWIVPAAIVVVIGAAILALPSYVASTTHRKAIEALASSLTGRHVRIEGDLSLGLFPSPQFIAKRITITGRHQEVITARSLTLDISVPSLLHGQLSARNLTLESPVIGFPWPLPGGATAIAPPSWLAALHAEIHNGTVTFGAETFKGVEASIFTGANGAVTISGTGGLSGRIIQLSLALGGALLNGTAPLSIDAHSGDAQVLFSGSLDNESVVDGQIHAVTPKITGNATVVANATGIRVSTIQAKAGTASVTGQGHIDFAKPELILLLNAENPDLVQMKGMLDGITAMPVSVTLNAANASLAGQVIPSLQTEIESSPAGLRVARLTASLSGNSTLSAAFNVSSLGVLTGAVSAQGADLETCLAGFGISAPGALANFQLNAKVTGSIPAIVLNGLDGVIGGDHVEGRLVLMGRHIAGALRFGDLNLPLLAAWLGGHPDNDFTASGEITADNASLGPLTLKSLLVDADYDGALNIRRLSAALDHGLVSGSLSLDHNGQITAAQGFLALPSAAPLIELLPAAFVPPSPVLQTRLNLVMAASGPPTALATSAVASLGDFTVTAAPVINIGKQSAIGPLSLRNPNAILALNQFGLNRGLDWPGAGSVSLRATMMISPAIIGFPDFILSIGRTAANGRLLSNNGDITGTIDADSLTLPPLLAASHLPWAALGRTKGQITLNARTLIYPGLPNITHLEAGIRLKPQNIHVVVKRAELAGGDVTGSVLATTSAVSAPALSAELTAAKLDASLLDLPVSFPITLPAGLISVKLALSATGYSPKIWLATLGGTADLTAESGTLAGFSIGGLTASLSGPDRARHLRAALAAGFSNFKALRFSGMIDHGNCTITDASLSGPDGDASATGSIDLYDSSLALQISMSPDVHPKLNITTTLLGRWDATKKYPKLGATKGWRPAG